MKGMLFLAWRYLAYHWIKAVILIASITLILFLPVGLRVLVQQSRSQLTLRAQSTPLIIGSKGSPLELVLNACYFSSKVPELIPYGHVEEVLSSGFAQAIPLYVRFHAQNQPIVGTSLDYFNFRGLRVAAGRQISRLGDCVVGAELAKKKGLQPGDTIISSPEKVFDLVGVYPLKMKVTGVLAFSDSPDDAAIFVDIKTAWIIEGLAHGHNDLSSPAAASQVLKQQDNVVIGNASVVEYTTITDANINSFHFHGDPATFNITSILAVPDDHKGKTLLIGRYKTDPETPYQILEPDTILDDLLATIMTIERFVVTAFVVVGISTLVIAALVFMLSLRLRKREILTMGRIGGSRLTVNCIVVSEIVFVLLASIVLAAGLTFVTGSYATDVIRFFL
jgi:putative ABC transport system permease protein